MSKHSSCNHHNCCSTCANSDNAGVDNPYIWMLIIILYFNCGIFWNGYNNVFSTSAFNCNLLSNGRFDINNFGSNSSSNNTPNNVNNISTLGDLSNLFNAFTRN